MRQTWTRLTVAAALGGLALTVPVAADAKTRFNVRGAGFGHGVGMSQYGAYGFALQGATYDRILRHYYTGTSLGSSAGTTIRVLLQSGVSTARFSGARKAGGRRVSASKTYGARASGSQVQLLSPSGRVLRTVAAPLVVHGAGGTVRLAGGAMNDTSDGLYRGRMEFRPGSGGLLSVNALGIDDYVRGVVARESPSSWPAEALKAQAVAARTYALTTTKGGTGWDHYPDTRSQVYGGVSAETPTTDAAVAATAGKVVTYQGRPVVTFFFSTSGGRTEDVENTSLGSGPLPWLKSVEDPYDDQSPKHRWGPYRWRMSTPQAKLRGLVRGRFKGIEVVKRGTSPRIVAADIVGSRGRTRVSGATLRAELGLFDTWAYFTTIKTKRKPRPATSRSASTGARAPENASPARERLVGRIMPRRAGLDVTVQQRVRRKWRTVGSADTNRKGRYAFAVQDPGRYRVKVLGDRGPAVRVR